MGLIQTITGKRIYLDSNIFIYGVERHPVFSDVVRQIFEHIDDEQGNAITSELTLAEVLVQPNKKRLDWQKTAYIDIITGDPSLEAVCVTREILIQSANMRVRTGMKLPDAIHVTTAKESMCDFFITNDGGIRVPESMTRILVSDFVSTE